MEQQAPHHQHPAPEKDAGSIDNMIEQAKLLSDGYSRQFRAGARIAAYEWEHSKYCLVMSLVAGLALIIVLTAIWGLINAAVGLLIWQVAASVWPVVSALLVINALIGVAIYFSLRTYLSQIGFHHTVQAIFANKEPGPDEVDGGGIGDSEEAYATSEKTTH